MAAAEQKPLSNLPQLIPEAVFMEDVESFLQGTAPQSGQGGHVLAAAAAAAAAAACPPEPAWPHRALTSLSHEAGRTAEEVLNELRGAHQKYKYIEAEIVQRKKRLSFKQVPRGRPHGCPPSMAACLQAAEWMHGIYSAILPD